MQLRQIDNLLINDMVLYYFFIAATVFFEGCILSNIVYRLYLDSTTYRAISIFNYWILKEKINVLRKVDLHYMRDVGDRWTGWAITQPCFDRSVNPISTRGGRLCPSTSLPITAYPPRVLRTRTGDYLSKLAKRIC